MHKRATIIAALFACVVLGAAAIADEPAKPMTAAGDWDSMRSIQPRQYLCHITHDPITIDGQAREAAWQAAEWTDDFSDIEGPRRPKPRFRTRAKMLWDDTYFYVYAELEEPHVWATITKKNEVIFRDNDFEVFIDPEGSNHHYHEFEMNALGTIWELSLDRPYRDGGPIHDPDNLPGLRSAVHIRGTINNPSDTDQGWSVEIAFPWEGLKKYAGRMASPPHEGDTWRIDFSRVEWLVDIIDGKYRKIPPEMRPEDNWVWSPQGIINMHAPERWGRVQFTRQPPGQGKFIPDPTAATRDALMEVYHRQRVYRDAHKRYATSLAELGWMPADAPGFSAASLRLEPRTGGFLASAEARMPDGSTATLHTREDSYLWRGDAEAEATVRREVHP